MYNKDQAVSSMLLTGSPTSESTSARLRLPALQETSASHDLQE